MQQFQNGGRLTDPLVAPPPKLFSAVTLRFVGQMGCNSVEKLRVHSASAMCVAVRNGPTSFKMAAVKSSTSKTIGGAKLIRMSNQPIYSESGALLSETTRLKRVEGGKLGTLLMGVWLHGAIWDVFGGGRL